MITRSLTHDTHTQVFSAYETRSLPPTLQQLAKPHPGAIAEPASLAAVPLPPIDFPCAFPDDMIASGKLSSLQLEGALHACSKHLIFLPNGERAGFFIGDGAGTGKGRQIAAVIIDSYIRGRVKSVWISTSTDLFADAKRDLADLGAHSIPVHPNLQSLDAATVTPTEGVMFMTYSTLTSSGAKGRPSRVHQLIDWVGGSGNSSSSRSGCCPSFDGVLVFDECHKSKNFSDKPGQGTKLATAVVNLQKALPNARVLYCSATGVSEVANLAYASRLGLFGPGTSFPTFDIFLNSLKRKGISFLELLAMELKANGFYVSRGLSFHEAEFVGADAPVGLSPAQIDVYNAAVEAWIDLRRGLATAVALCPAARDRDPFRPFWGAQQRFFKLLCVSMKVPAVVEQSKKALEEGYCVVIGLQTTGEAAADALELVPGDNVGFISVTKEIMLQFVKNHFPTLRGSGSGGSGDGIAQNAMAVEEEEDDGGDRCSPNTNNTSNIEGEVDPTAVQLKEEMLRRINELRLPPNFLDELIDALGGKHAVAEMTGRKARVVRDHRHRPVYELRAKPDSSEMDSLNIKEKEAFLAGKKLVAIISDAASTGISLHADCRVSNQRRRMHLTIELPWSADKAIQQLGRSHRSNQSSAPVYKLIFTELGGERRFAAAVARRLQSLGALTRGDRRAASGLDLGTLNYDSPLGRRAVKRMYDALAQRSPLFPLQGMRWEEVMEGVPAGEAQALGPVADGVDAETNTPTVSARSMVEAVERLHTTLSEYVGIMGIALNGGGSGDAATSTASATAPPAQATDALATSASGDVRRFLNRLLAVPVHRQRLLFNYFLSVLNAEIAAAKAAGVYSEGVSDLPGQNISRKAPASVLWTDPLSGLQTLHHVISVDRGVSFTDALSQLDRHIANANDRSGFYRSRRPLPGSNIHGVLLALQKPGDASAFSIVRPGTGPSFIEWSIDDLKSKYHSVLADQAGEEWEEQYEGALTQCSHGLACRHGPTCSAGKRLLDVSLLTGSIVRIWDALERVLARHEFELSKAERTMRIVRVEGCSLCGGGEEPQGTTLPLIGLRYPGNLLPEVVTTLMSDGLSVPQRSGGGGGGVHRSAVEPPAPVQPKLLKKAFTAKKTVLDFFKKKNTTSAAGGSGSGNEMKPSAATLPTTKKRKEPSSTTTSSHVAAMFHATMKKANQENREDGGSGGGEIFTHRQRTGESSGTNGNENDTSAKVESLCTLGFEQQRAEHALHTHHGNVEAAADWLLNTSTTTTS